MRGIGGLIVMFLKIEPMRNRRLAGIESLPLGDVLYLPVVGFLLT
jgi:hypothetical protein